MRQVLRSSLTSYFLYYNLELLAFAYRLVAGEEELKKLRKKYEALSQLSQITVSTKAPSLLEERPSRCPECGASRIWKNGTYQVTGERTSRSLILREKGTVQRFRCSHCGVKLYLVKKKQK